MIERYETRHNRIPITPGYQYCMRCHMPKPKEGGADKLSADGMRRKWHCKDCNKED